MRNIVKHIAGRIYKPLLVKYLSSTRTYVYQGIHLVVPPEVFHPGFFFSTKLLLRHISRQQPIKGKTFLELGAGSGLISLYAAREGAEVTAIDINPVAIQYLGINCIQNKLPVNIILSDLFSHVPQQAFDVIAINPPYYKKQPQSFAEYAWYCGENGEYFTGLFSELRNYTHEKSAIWMVLCDGCDEKMIQETAARYHWNMNYVATQKTLWEKNFIIKIESLL